MKLLLKRFIVIWTIICTLLPTLFMGVVLADDTLIPEEGYINAERAGNYAANFAINFYDNWSSVNTVDSGTGNTGSFGFPLQDGTYSSTSEFAEVRTINGQPNKHNGIDYGAAQGTPVFACASGEVIEVYNQAVGSSWGAGNGYGNHVLIKTGEVAVMYGHFQNVTFGLSVGDNVEQGEQIGVVGSTGNSTGPHLHLEFMTNNIDGLDSDKYMAHAYAGYSYSIDPNLYTSGGKSAGSTSRKTSYGVIKTEYSENSDPYLDVNETDAKYALNNKSWISFVYRHSLFKGDANRVYSGSGNVRVNSATFNNKKQISGVKELTNESEILDISRMMSEGKVLPGDILCATKGVDGEVEYLLYVGGTKIIYATANDLAAPSGALKYEYMDYYLKRIKNDLMAGHENDENYKLPKYGIVEVYRIKPEVAVTIPETDTNLFFNGKGYYSKVTYEGIPANVSLSQTSFSLFQWIFDKLLQLLELLINIMLYAVRMCVVTVVTLFENLIQYIVLGISGDYQGSGMEAFFGTSATSASGDKVTVESIFFNRIPILDANFFNFEEAGGHSLTITNEVYGPVRNEDDRFVTMYDGENIVYILRRNLNVIYVVIRNLSIALLLFVLVAVGIRIALTSIAEKKAEYKQFLISWVYAMCVVLLIHFFMFAVFAVNEKLVGFCEDLGKGAAQETVADVIERSKSDEEINLYDAIRIKAYAFDWREGVPATVVYIYLVYLLVRFLFIYFKRYLTIYILALSASFMGVKYAIDRLLGKKTNSLNKWFKDFSFNVLLQTVHAFIYVVFMGVAISVSQTSVGGALVALVILNFMLKADQLIIKIFGLDKAGSLQDVNKQESWMSTFKNLLPIYFVSRGAVQLANGVFFFGKDGLIRRLAYAATGKDTRKDAQKQLDKWKYNAIGGVARKLEVPIAWLDDKGIPIRLLFKYNKYNAMLGKDLSYDSNKAIYKEIKGYKQANRERFTRKLGLFTDLTLGTVGTIAAVGVAIGDPAAGLATLATARGRISKHKTLSRTQRKMDTYKGTKAQALKDYKDAKTKYKEALSTHTNNEYNYQVEYNRLLDAYQAETAGSTAQKAIENQIGDLLKQRKRERAKEMHTLQESYEKVVESKVTFGNAKHEKNSNNIFGKARQNDRKTREKIFGLDAIENIATTETRAEFNAGESRAKQKKKLDDMVKATKLEREFNELMNELKAEQKRYKENNNKSDDESETMFNRYMAKTVKESKELNVSSTDISRAINEYMHEHAVDKVDENAVDEILDKVQNSLRIAGKKTEITEDTKAKVRKAFEDKMIKDNKGLGYDVKDATVAIREALGKKDAIRSTEHHNEDDSGINNKLNEILQKINEINTFNEVAKAKHKSSLINVKKMIKESIKKGK